MAAEAKRLRTVPAASPQPFRCAIYTRKSKDEGLEQEFNSLDAQRESSESFIGSQRLEGWIVLPKRYDDGGFTGGSMDRPSLQQLLADVESGEIDCIVVYKVDRLTRSIHDFFKILEILEKHNVTFVSVTQQFNTTTSIGRLTLNMLLSFAQFERETISERTRDKMRATRRKGKWTGGNLVLGYDLSPKGGALVINSEEAERVREIFRSYLELGSLIPVIEKLDRHNWRMKTWTARKGGKRGGAGFNKNTLYNLLTNATYMGKVKFDGQLYEGEHPRIIDDETFNRVQEQLKRHGRNGGKVRNKGSALLKGLLRCGSCGAAMTHTYVQKDKRRYRYYVCMTAHQRGWNQCQTRSVSAPELEEAVINNIRAFMSQPALLSEVLRRIEESREQSTPMADPGQVRDALLRFDPLWAQLTISEQERFIRLLVQEVRYDGRTQTVTVGFRSEGIKKLCEQPRDYQ